MSESSWYYTENGQQAGPVPESALRQLAAAGRVQPHDLVWRDGLPQWTPARDALPNLFTGATGAAPTPPLAPAPPMQPAYPGAPGAMPLGYQGPPPPGAYPGPAADPAMQWVVPVGRSGWAIAAGYLGLFSLVCGLLGPVAIIISIVALNDLKRNPQASGMGRVVTGFVCGGLGTIAAVAWFFFVVLEGGR